MKKIFLFLTFLFLFFLLPSFKNPAFALCNQTACAAKGNPTYACTGTGNNCEQYTWSCRPTPITSASTCTFGPHNPGQAQNLCCPGGGACSNGSCVTSTYTCTNVAKQYCNDVSCSTDGDIAGTGTCPPNRHFCCKPKTTTTQKYKCVPTGCVLDPTGSHTTPDCDGACFPAPNCEASNLGKCMPVCSSPVSGTTGCVSPNVCCGTSSTGQCPVCTLPYYYDPYTKKCVRFTDREPDPYIRVDPTYKTCSAEQTCSPGYGCNLVLPNGFTSGSLPCGPEGKNCYTAFGKINIDPASLVKAFFGIVLSISGGIAILLIILSGYRLIASQGNPEKIKEAQEHLTAAIIGLLFVIFSFSILRFIGVDVLGLFSHL